MASSRYWPRPVSRTVSARIWAAFSCRVFMGSWFRWRSWLRGGGGSGPAAQPGGPVDAVEVHQLGGRVGGAHAAGPGAHHHLALAVAGGVQPVGHAGV